MPSCSPRLLLAKLHDEFDTGRVHFVTARSIDRLRQALFALYSALGGRSSASHAARFNLLGRSHRLGLDIKFAEKTINGFDRKKVHARKLAVRSGERMAVKIYMGDISGSSRRNSGSWPPNRICPQPLVPRSVKSFAAT